jgi:PAS domain S-box-containing protein
VETTGQSGVNVPRAAGAKPFRVLLIEDNAGDVRLLQELLAERAAPFVLENVARLSDGLRRLQKGGIDLVLLDLSLPDGLGLETFARLHAEQPGAPVIVLSGMDDEALAVKAVQQGAQDYLVKGRTDRPLLVRAMRYAIERHRVEEALARERDLLHILLENIPDRIYFKDRKSRFVRINRALAELFKLRDPAEAIGKTDFDFFTPEHAQPAFEDEQQIIRTGQPLVGKIEKETLPDGRVGWAFTSKVPLRDKRGRIIGTFGISKDITQHIVMEERLAEERNLLRSLIDSSPDPIYVKDHQCRFLVANCAVARFCGLQNPDELVGKSDFDLFPRELAQQFYDEEQQILNDHTQEVSRETAITDHAGERRWVLTTKVPLRDSHGRTIGIVGINRDITARKQSEEQLQQLNADLARSQRELLGVFDQLQKSHQQLQAAQMQLIQAEKMESVGRLAAGVAHEVKNPLASLAMGLEFLTQHPAAQDSDVAQVLRDMTSAIQRADSVVRGLLDFSVASELQARETDIHAVVENALRLVRLELARGRIQVVREFAPGLPPLKLDSNRIEQVFVNVLLNAVHAMPRGGTLTVRSYTRQLQPADVERDAGDRTGLKFRAGDTVVVVDVDDTGTGIPPEKLAIIFDPFYTSKATGKGTGLGLTVTRKIVELHGGSITLQNRPEGGARATIILKPERRT